MFRFIIYLPKKLEQATDDCVRNDCICGLNGNCNLQTNYVCRRFDRRGFEWRNSYGNRNVRLNLMRILFRFCFIFRFSIFPVRRQSISSGDIVVVRLILNVLIMRTKHTPKP